MMTLISYIGAHWFLILSVIGIAVALSVFAFVTKNLYAVAAAVCVVFAGLFYQSADLGGYKRALDEAKAAQIQTLTNRLATLSLVNSLDAQRAVADAKLNTQLESLTFETPPNATACFDRAAAGRVRAVR